MPVYLIAFTMHAASDTPAERQRVETRADGMHRLIANRFPERRTLSERTYAVEAAEGETMVTVWAYAENSDEVYVVPMSGPALGNQPNGVDALDWLQARF